MSLVRLFITTKNVSSGGPEGHYCDVEVFADHVSAVNCAFEMAREYCRDVERRHTGSYDVTSEDGAYQVNIGVIKKTVELPLHYELHPARDSEERAAASL